MKIAGLLVSAALVAAGATLLSGCNKSDAGTRFTPVGEEKQIQGKVVDAKLTVCGPTPEKPGTCEGTLVVEPAGAGAAGRVPIEVTHDVVLKKGGQTVFLPQLRDSQATVKYRASQEGANVATFVSAQ